MGATMVAAKFSDTLTLFHPGGRFCPPSAWSHLHFSCGYVPEVHISIDHVKHEYPLILITQMFVLNNHETFP